MWEWIKFNCNFGCISKIFSDDWRQQIPFYRKHLQKQKLAVTILQGGFNTSIAEKNKQKIKKTTKWSTDC